MKVISLIVTILFSLIAYSQDNSMPGMDSMPGMNMPGMEPKPQQPSSNQVKLERTETPQTQTPTPAREQSTPTSVNSPRPTSIAIPDLPEIASAPQNVTRRPVVVEKIGENTQKCDEPCVTCEPTKKCQSTRSYDTTRDTNESSHSSGKRIHTSAGSTPQ